MRPPRHGLGREHPDQSGALVGQALERAGSPLAFLVGVDQTLGAEAAEHAHHPPFRETGRGGGSATSVQLAPAALGARAAGEGGRTVRCMGVRGGRGRRLGVQQLSSAAA